MEDDHHRFPMDLHDLQLTKQQYQAIEETMREYQSSSRLYHKQNAKTQQELNALFLNPTFDEKTFRVLQKNEQQIVNVSFDFVFAAGCDTSFLLHVFSHEFCLFIHSCNFIS